jgi:hypothetical protein
MFLKRMFLLWFLGVFVVSAQGANLLTNGNFNTGDLTAWDVNLAVVAGADINAAVQTAINYDGSPCLFMRSRTGLWQGAEVHQVVDVNGLTTVDFSCVANKWAWGDVRVDLNWYSGPYDPCNLETNWLSWEQWDIVVDGAETSDWDSFAHTFTVPSTAKYVVFRLRVNDWTWQVYFDDVFFGTPVLDQATLMAPAPGSSVSQEDKSNCGFGPTLQWAAATDATGDHYVYFGTSFTDVNDANTGDPQFKGSVPLGTTSYTLSLANVNKGQAYFWRVDETVDGNVVKAQSVWQFSVSNLTWVDRFDNYISDANIQAIWGPNSTVVDYTMQIYYYSIYNEVSADATDLLCSTDISENAMLVLLVKGHDDMSDNIYVKLESNDGAESGFVQYPDVRALNQQSYEPFILWPIDLQDFASQGVDLTNVTRIAVGVGAPGSPPANSGTISIDDIRLDYPWCDTSMAQMIPADFSKNCWVGFEDLDLLAANWLVESVVITASAPATGPILWYKLDEGTGYDPLDSSGNHYDGFISDLYAWGGAGSGHDGTNCVYLGNTNWIEITDIGVNNDHNTIGAESTVSFWLKDPGQTDEDSMILQIGTDGHSLNLWTDSTGSFSYKAGWNTSLGYGDTLDIGSFDYTNPDHPQDEWVHYAFVKSLSGNFTRAYRNGELIAESTADAAETPLIDGVNSFASIGAWRWSGGTGGYYDGWIDDFRIYDYALSPEQVLYLAVEGGTATSPMTQELLTSAEATGDGLVNFEDFAIMAQYWLQNVVWPQD